jgi:hypothetical protein
VNASLKAQLKIVGALVLAALLVLFVLFRGGYRTLNLAENIRLTLGLKSTYRCNNETKKTTVVTHQVDSMLQKNQKSR